MMAKMQNQIKDIPVDLIIVPRSHRTPMHGKVAAMAESIRMNRGIIQPIMVRPSKKHEGKYDMVFGGHRLAGAKAEKLATIPAIITTKNDLECELAEIDENFQRANLSVIEESVCLARRRQICAILAQQRTPSEGSNGVPCDGTLPMQEEGRPIGDFLSEAITLTGHSAKTATERANLGDKLSAVAADLLKDTPAGDSVKQVAILAELPKADQVNVAKAIASGKADSVKEAIAARDGEQDEPEENLSAAVLQAINTEKIKPTANQREALAKLPEEVQDAIAESVIAGRESLGTAIANGCAADPTVEERLTAQSKQIESTCRAITAFAKEQIDALTDPWIDDSGRRDLALEEIKKACNTLRSAKASAKCPKCDGEGCRTCHKTGYVNRYTLQQVA